MYSIVRKAKTIIFENEGHYRSVNRDDNGACSVGIVQWHGSRAKALLRKIIEANRTAAANILPLTLMEEILSGASWERRVLDQIEGLTISRLLSGSEGRSIQDKQAETDVQAYINHIAKLGFEDENILIFLADIENQGGSGASERIGKAALKAYGSNVTLAGVYKAAVTDRVFKAYTQRRNKVYQKLTGSDFVPDEHPYTVYEVKAGDNLTKIAKKFKTTIDRIVKDNNIPDPDQIVAKQQLKIY